MNPQTAREQVLCSWGRGSKLCRKRLAEATTGQPASKRWKVQAYPDSVGSMGQQTSSWATADVAGLIGNDSRKAGQEVVGGGFGLHMLQLSCGYLCSAAHLKGCLLLQSMLYQDHSQAA